MLTDIRRALRSLLRTPGFFVVAVVTLALGIGATTSLFTAVDAVLLRSLPFPEPDRLVMLWVDGTKRGFARQDFSNPADIADFNAQMPGVEAAGGWTGWGPTLIEGDTPERLAGGSVTHGYFDALRPAFALGRGFTKEEDVPNGPRVVVVTHAFWQRVMHGAADAIGKPVRLDGEPWTVVGVLPPSFQAPLLPDRDVFRPLQGDPAARGGFYLQVLARLKPGASIAAVDAEMDAVEARLGTAYPDANKDLSGYVQPLHEAVAENVRLQLLVLLGATLLVLLIACANLANLLLARAASRSRELAVRSAIGAGRWRVARQLLAEGVVLAGAGTVFGVVLAAFGTRWIATALPDAAALGDVSLDLRALGFAALAALASAMLFGLAPVFAAGRQNLTVALREGDRGAAGGRRGTRFREALVVATFGLALALTAGAGVFLKSLDRLETLDPGFRPEGALTFTMRLPPSTYPDAAALRPVLARLREELGALPGVTQVGLTSTMPLGDNDTDTSVGLAGQPADAEPVRAWYSQASTGYLEALGVRLLAGRTISDEDTDTAPCRIVINEAFARTHFAGRDPLAQRIALNPKAEQPTWCDVGGVVGDVRFFGLDTPQTPAIYLPMARFAARSFFVVLRGAGDPGTLAAPARAAVARVDSNLAIADVQPMTLLVANSLRTPRLVATLAGAFALLALVLAAVGVYGVISYAVGQRTRELGVRAALGASRRELLAGVLKRGVALAGAGIALGAVLAVVLGRVVQGLLYEVKALDPIVLLGVAALLAGVALLACLAPALRASRVDPMRALRDE